NMERMGAIAVLKDPNNAVCMEYTDMFIALAREHNIASREVVGYAVTNDEELRPISFLGDILHAWPEYYDSAREYWRPIDPTWGDTSVVDYFSALDLNHISLVYHGKDTTYPLPPGVYKVNKNTKDVRVKPTYEIPRMESTYEITVPEKIVFNANTNNTLTFLLNAKMPVLGYNVLLELVDKNSQKVLSGMTLPVLEPYANKKLSFSIDTKMGILSKGNVLVRVNGTLVKEIPYEVTTQVVNILRKYGFIFVGLGIVLGILLLLKLYEHKSS
ncbi:MAG: transglutaminase domain-containing protein, partial [Patescibacteria group bacterium]